MNKQKQTSLGKAQALRDDFLRQVHYPTIKVLKNLEGETWACRSMDKMSIANQLEENARQMIYTAAAIMDTIETGKTVIESSHKGTAEYKTYRKSRLHKLRKALGYAY